MERELDEAAWAQELAGEVDAPPAGELGSETEEETPRKPAKHPTTPARGKIMTAQQYVKLLKKLDLSPYKAGPVLGISPRMSMRYAAGTHAIPETVAKLIRALIKLGRHDV